MARNEWNEKLGRLKEHGRPEAVLMLAGQAELMRIALAWSQTQVTRARRLTKLRSDSDSEVWAWL